FKCHSSMQISFIASRSFCLITIFCILLGERTNAQGYFQKEIQFSNSCFINSIGKTQDTGFIIAGSVSKDSNGISKSFVAKFDSAGVIQWSKAIGDSVPIGALSIIQTSDNGYAFSGRILKWDSTNNEDIYAA